MSERQRLHDVYAGYRGWDDAYSLGNPAHLFALQGRQRAILARLAERRREAAGTPSVAAPPSRPEPG